MTFEQYPILTKWGCNNCNDLLSVYYVASIAQWDSHALSPCVTHIFELSTNISSVLKMKKNEAQRLSMVVVEY